MYVQYLGVVNLKLVVTLALFYESFSVYVYYVSGLIVILDD